MKKSSSNGYEPGKFYKARTEGDEELAKNTGWHDPAVRVYFFMRSRVNFGDNKIMATQKDIVFALGMPQPRVSEATQRLLAMGFVVKKVGYKGLFLSVVQGFMGETDSSNKGFTDLIGNRYGNAYLLDEEYVKDYNYTDFDDNFVDKNGNSSTTEERGKYRRA